MSRLQNNGTWTGWHPMRVNPAEGKPGHAVHVSPRETRAKRRETNAAHAQELLGANRVNVA